MHYFLINVTMLLDRNCHSSNNIILETYTLDVRDILHDTFICTLTTTTISDLRATIDRTENRVNTKQVVKFDCFQQCSVRLEIR